MALGKAKRVIENPFIEGTSIPDELFCDRVEETAQIISLVKNGNNVVLKAPRRIGKSSLLNHIFLQKDIRDNYNTLYLDLLGTNSAAEFIQSFQRAFVGAKFTRRSTVAEMAKSIPGRLYFEHRQDLLQQTQGFRFGLTEFNGLTLSLDEIFNRLEKMKRPNIVVFDEFQQVKYYPEPMSAILRSYIQRMNNTRFIFSGSSRRMLTTMFSAQNEPFYNSAEAIDLDVISEKKYEEFCKKKFREYEKDITEDSIEFTYNLTDGNTYELQRIMRQTFAGLGKGETADRNSIISSVNGILDRNDQTYREKLSMLNNTKERKVFLAIALEGIAFGVMSKDFIKKYDLGAVSSISQSLRNLCDEEKLNLAVRLGDSYKLQDKMFELWIARQYGVLDGKYAFTK